MSRRATQRGDIFSIASRFFSYLPMYMCYVDESGTPEIPGTSSHFVLAGLTIPIFKWNICENDINKVKKRYGLLDHEIHTGWLLRNYTEQNKTPNFETLSWEQRRSEVQKYRNQEIYRLQKQSKQLKQTKKNYKQTESYIHLTLSERKQFVGEIADTISSWGFARLFAECIDKVFFDPNRTETTIDEQGFEQIISRFEPFLQEKSNLLPEKCFGLVIHDNNETISKRHTLLMKRFHQKGTIWRTVNHVIETPLFVDSSLTSMIQIADVCAYSIRRYLENNETNLFDKIFQRAHKKGSLAVGVRHFTNSSCVCKICQAHKLPKTNIKP